MKWLGLVCAAICCTLPPAMAASLDGAPIHYSATGKGPKTVVLVHGWTCDETTWADQVPALAREYRMVTVDLPGHGKSLSPKFGTLSMDLFARAIEAVRAELKAERIVLVGHSMGTPVVVQYARLIPEHTAALVFVDGLLTMGGRMPDERQFMGEAGRAARERMVGGMYSASTTPAMQTRISHMMLAAPESTAIGGMRAMADKSIWKDDVLAMPILGLYADKSALGNRDYIKAHFPNMEYVEIPGTGHFLMMEKAEEFNRLLAGFLAKQKY